MKPNRNWIIGIILTATVGAIALQNGIASKPETATDLPFTTFTDTPTATYEPCSYTWAYHDDPVLSPKIDQAVRVINRDASANAQLFGEDCVYADGHSTFGAMETDFYVHFPVEDLSREEDLGDLVKRVMDIIVPMPEDDIQGNKGFVEFTFSKTDTEQIIFRAGIYDYLNIPTATTGAELLSNFYTPSPPPATIYPATATPTQ